MDFKETYKKYLNGEATDEEKAFVETEIEKARLVNAEILSASDTQIKTPEEKIKAKKKKSLRQTVKTIIISAAVFFVISTIIVWVVGFFAISNAKNNLNTDETQAITLATEEAYIYARDKLSYTGSMEQMIVKKETKEIKVEIPLKKSHYLYEFEFVAGDTEIDIEVHATSGKAEITSIERFD